MSLGGLDASLAGGDNISMIFLGRAEPVNKCRSIHSVGTTNGVVRINPHDLFASQAHIRLVFHLRTRLK